VSAFGVILLVLAALLIAFGVAVKAYDQLDEDEKHFYE